MIGGWIDNNGEFIRIRKPHSVYNALMYEVTLQDNVLQFVNIGNATYTLNYSVILHTTDSLWLKPLDEKTQSSYTGFVYFNGGNGADEAKNTTNERGPDTLKFFNTRLFVRDDFHFKKMTGTLNESLFEAGNDVFHFEIDSAKNLYIYSSLKKDSLESDEAFYLKIEDEAYDKLIFHLQLTGFQHQHIIPGADFRFKIAHDSTESFLYFNLANFNFRNDEFFGDISNLNDAARAKRTVVKKRMQPLPAEPATFVK